MPVCYQEAYENFSSPYCVLLERIIQPSISLSNSTPFSQTHTEPDGYSHDEIEEKIFASVAAASSPVQSSVVYPQDQVPPIRRYLDEAKEQLDVIDFTQPHDDSL